MKKGLKVLSISLLLSTLVFAGCSCSKGDKKNVSRIENSGDSFLEGTSDDSSKYTLKDIYDSLIANNSGNTLVADKIVEFIGEEILDINNPESVWKSRYDNLVKEKLADLTDSSEYLVKGEFSESYLVETLKAQGYNITCANGYGTKESLACDYTDYINKEIKVDVLSTLIKEKYIQDVTLKDRKNVLTNKKIRDVEYLTISSSLDNSYDELSVRDFMREVRNRISNGEVVDFETVEEEFKQKLKDIIETEFNKIGTSEDYSQSIAAEYTNNFTQSAEKGKQDKLKAIDNSEYSFSKFISSDSEASAVVSSTITDLIRSVDDFNDSKFARTVVKVNDGTSDLYYLVSSNATNTVDASDVLISETSDSSNYVYSIVRFRIINSDTTDENDLYEAVKILAEESTLANNALSHYLEERKDLISVYDDDVYAYLKNLYPDIFTD